MFFDHSMLKECEVCGNQSYGPCASCNKEVCVEHGTKKVVYATDGEEDSTDVVFYCNDHA